MTPTALSNLSVHFAGFDPKTHPHLQMSQSLVVTEASCIHAAMSVGAPYFFVGTPPDNHAVRFALYKALALILAVEIAPNGIRRRKEYNALDSTEKRNLSYWLGMTFAAIAANEALDVQYLVHAESMHKANRLIKSKGSGKSLADLIGKDSSSQWHVLEAKSRQVEPPAKEVAKWKAQAANTIDTIDGATPHTLSCSSLVLASRASVTLIDPEPGKRAPSISFADSRFDLLRWYYAPWLAALDRGVIEVEIGPSVGLVAASFSDTLTGRRIDVGLTLRAWRVLNEGGVPEEAASAPDGRSFVGRDGIFVRMVQGPPAQRRPA